jgi:hypothetical protein
VDAAAAIKTRKQNEPVACSDANRVDIVLLFTVKKIPRRNAFYFSCAAKLLVKSLPVMITIRF